jgi:hypothetical protein
MQSSHFETLNPTKPYLTSFAEIEQQRHDFNAMDHYFKRHPFTYSFLNQSDHELYELLKLRKECNKPFKFRPRSRMNFNQLDQLEYLRQMNPEHKQIMQTQATQKYQLVKDYHKFPYDFHQKQDQLYQEELKLKEQSKYT